MKPTEAEPFLIKGSEKAQEWNLARAAAQSIPNLRHADLSELELSGIDFSGVYPACSNNSLV
ncbi:MAG: hypothetical protein JJ992_23800, partial [Planctomycetes bacterium]|nr:hypothetical protein [Planctomycetota bacterium]